MGDAPAVAKSYAIASAMDVWNRRHAEGLPAQHCAGCSRVIGDRPSLELFDGAVVHDGNDLACLIAYGRRWRRRAYAALLAMCAINRSDAAIDLD